MIKIQPISMEADTFELMKRDMTDTMNDLLRNMQEYGENEATMTLKMNISLENQRMDNDEIVTVPIFKHKITFNVQIKIEKSGMLGGGYTLESDGKGGYYLRKVVEQVDMFGDT